MRGAEAKNTLHRPGYTQTNKSRYEVYTRLPSLRLLSVPFAQGDPTTRPVGGGADRLMQFPYMPDWVTRSQAPGGDGGLSSATAVLYLLLWKAPRLPGCSGIVKAVRTNYDHIIFISLYYISLGVKHRGPPAPADVRQNRTARQRFRCCEPRRIFLRRLRA